MGINIIIVLNIVFMVGRGYEQRVKIDYLNAQLLQVVHLVQYALQVSSVELTDIHLCRIPSPVFYTVHRLPDIAVFIGQHIVGRIAIAETIRINLVHYRTFCPVGSMEAGNDDKVIILVDLLHQSSHIEDTCDPAGLYLKIVGYLLIIQTHHISIVIKIIIALHSYHEMLLSTAYEEYPVHVVPCGTETDRHLGIWFRLFRDHILRTCIRKKSSSVKYRSHGSNILLIIFCST